MSKLKTHAQRCAERQKVNGKPYRDNPKGIPTDNDGNLKEFKTLREYRKYVDSKIKDIHTGDVK